MDICGKVFLAPLFQITFSRLLDKHKRSLRNASLNDTSSHVNKSWFLQLTLL